MDKSVFHKVLESEMRVTEARWEDSTQRFGPQAYQMGLRAGRIGGLEYALRVYDELVNQGRIREIRKEQKCESKQL